ncbi:MAG: DUF58 domain-containing protein [Acidimicrobiales bacterium]|jgi:uncharacterized protein (DUF58 family)
MFRRKADEAETQLHPYLDRRETVSAVLRRLELDINMRLDGLLQGDYRGLVPGHGSEPGETRRYTPGDDVRRIDWNVSARMVETYIRQTIADRELETAVAVDLTPSLDFGTADSEKRDLAAAATAAMGFLTLRVGNRFGAELIRPDGIESIPAKQGRSHVLHIVEQVLTAPRAESSTATLADGIARLHGPHRRKGMRAVISDFIDDSDWQQQLKLVSIRNQLIAVEIVDPREMELPNVGTLAVVDPETGRRREVQTQRRKVRDLYSQAAIEQRADIAQTFRESRTNHLQLSTDRDWLLDVVRFVATQKGLK